MIWQQRVNLARVVTVHHTIRKIENRQSKIENPLSWIWNRVQRNDFHSIAGRVGLASIEYCYNSFLRAIDADANEDISGKNITSYSYKIIAKQQKKLNRRAGYSFYRNFSTTTKKYQQYGTRN